MKINICRFADVDTIDVNIKTGVTGTEQITNLADKMLKLDKSVENAKVQLNAFKTLLKNLSTHSTTTMKNDLTKIKAAFDSVAAMKILPTDVRKSMQQLSTIFNIADKPKQLDKTVKSVNNLLNIYDKYEKVRGYSTDEEEDKGDYTTNRHQSIISTVGPVKELTLGYKSLLQQEQSNIDVMTKLYSAYNNIGSATKTAKTHIVTFDDAVKINVKTLEDEQKALEKYLTVSKSSSFLKTGGDTGVTSLLATTGSLQSTNNQFNNLQTYSFGAVKALTDATKGLYSVGDAAITNQPKVASFGDILESTTQKLKANTDELTKNQTATNNYQSALSLTSTFGGGGDIAKMAASGFDQSTVSLIQQVNGALKETGAVMTNTAGQSQTLTNKVTENKNIFQKLLDVTKKLPKNISDVEKGFRSLSLVRLTYLVNAVRRVTSGLVNAVENAANYEESLNLYKMSIGNKYLDDAEAWSKELTDKLMIDESELMQYTGTFNNLAEGLGVHQDDAYEMSKALTQLTYDMSSYLNIDPSAAATKLQSAMSGQARAIQSVGVAIQSASLQELAYELGIDKKVEKMTQAEKTYLRYIQILRTTEHMQGDLGATMITPANAIRILKTQITLLGRAIGQVLTPLIMEAIPWIMAFTNVLTKLATKLAAFLGYKVRDVEMGDAFNNAADSADDYADSVENAGKKVKNSLAPFDELNVVMSSSSGSGDANVDSILDKLRAEIEGYDMLSRYTGELKEKAKELEKYIMPVINGLIALFATKKVFDLGLWIKGATSALTGQSAAAAMGAGGLGALLSSLLVAGSVVVTIGCAIKVIGDIVELNKLYALMVENSKTNAEVNADITNKTEQDIASGEVAKNPQKYVDEFNNSSEAQNARLEGVLDNLDGKFWEWDNILTTIFTGGYKEMHDTLDNILDTYSSVNKNAKQLIGSNALNNDQLASMRDKLRDQRDTLEKYLNFYPKWTKEHKLINQAYEDTRDNIKLINDKLGVTDKTTNSIVADSMDWFDEQKSILEETMKQAEELENSKGSVKDLVKGTKDWFNNAVDIGEKLLGVKKDTNDTRTATDKITDSAKTWFNKIVGIGANMLGVEENTAATGETVNDVVKGTTDWFDKIVGVGKSLLDTNTNASKVNETLSVSETKTSTFGKLVDWVKGLFPSIKDEIDTVNERLVNSDTKTGTWKDNLATVKDTISEKITKPFGDFISKFTSKKTFSVDTTNADKTVNDLVTKSNKLNSTKTLKIKADTVNANSVIQKLFGGESLLGKLTKKLGFDIDFFADGGYPTSGELFFANENGRAEFITSIGNKTAVANQDQMVQALTNAIMAGFAMTSPRGESKQPINVNIGNERVYSGVIDYQNRQSDRYGTTTTINV